MKKIIFCLVLTAALSVSSIALAAAPQEEISSQDMMIKNGEWTALAQIYPISGVSNDISEALTPEVLAEWWNVFDDPTMTDLILRALNNNREIEAANARVKEARAALGVSRAALFPWIDTSDYWSNSRTPIDAGGGGISSKLFRLGIDASWEIDIFGGLRAKVRAQRSTLGARYAALYGTWTTLAAEVAINYINLRTLQDRIRFARHNAELQQNTVDIQQSKVDSGLDDVLALKQAQYTLQQTLALIPDYEASLESTMNILSILVGEVPGSLYELLSEEKSIPKISETALIGIPANAIRQRPDIREAERLLAAQIARKQSAEADLWPKFYLTGSIGTESGDWGSLFEGPAKLYSFMPRITWPIFHFGAIRSNIKVQGAIAEQLLAAYEQTVLNAVGEVRSALTSNVKEYERNASLKMGVEAAQVALDVANDKYSNGLVSFTNVIDAQAALTKLSEEYVVSTGLLSTKAIALFKALGGGWQP
ncbi:MAG: TolC family protein, partial [Synergistes sp.]|nr:TolC family protein [Synergistes sp.]